MCGEGAAQSHRDCAASVGGASQAGGANATTADRPLGVCAPQDCREWQVPWRSYGPEYSLAADTKVSAGLITSPLGAIDAASCLFTPAGSNEAMPLSSAPTIVTISLVRQYCAPPASPTPVG